MATLSTAWNIAQSALEANQAAINISANNAANANTPGYTAKTVVWQQTDSFTSNGTLPEGVSVTGSTAQRDRVLNGRIDLAAQDSAASQARLSALDDMQSVFSASLSSSGPAGQSADIGQQLSNFFNSLSQLAGNPANSSLRSGVLAAAQSLASSFNRTAQALTSQQTSLSATAGNVAGEVNSLTKDIAQLNGQIASVSPGTDTGSLEDQRQQDEIDD